MKEQQEDLSLKHTTRVGEVNRKPLVNLITTTYQGIDDAIYRINESIAKLTMMISKEYPIEEIQERLMPLVHFREMLEEMR